MSLKIDTRLVQPDPRTPEPSRPLSTPLYQTATFEQPSATEFGEYDYTRSGNPTRTRVQELLADLEGARGALLFSSGMAAIAAVTRLLRPGDRLVAGNDLYGGTFRLIDSLSREQGIEVVTVDATDLEAVAGAIDGHTRLVLLETPTNPRLDVVDVEAVSEIAHRHDARVVVDNSVMTPLRQRPLDLGADVTVHSATKGLSGHGDLIAGSVAFRDAELGERLAWIQNAEGAGLPPFECWLLARSLKTLAVRLAQQERTAAAVAEFLRTCPEVSELLYPGLSDHPGHAVHERQATGPGSLVCFHTGDVELSRAIVDGTRLFHTSVSFGSVISLISVPCHMSHASTPATLAGATPPAADLVRLSVGLEDPDDLIADLARALATARARRQERLSRAGAPA